MARPKPSYEDRAARGGYFRRTDQDDTITQDAQASKHPDAESVRQPEAQAVVRLRRTYYLPPATVLRLQEIQTARLRLTGEKPELSDLVTEAIALLPDPA